MRGNHGRWSSVHLCQPKIRLKTVFLTTEYSGTWNATWILQMTIELIAYLLVEVGIELFINNELRLILQTSSAVIWFSIMCGSKNTMTSP